MSVDRDRLWKAEESPTWNGTLLGILVVVHEVAAVLGFAGLLVYFFAWYPDLARFPWLYGLLILGAVVECLVVAVVLSTLGRIADTCEANAKATQKTQAPPE